MMRKWLLLSVLIPSLVIGPPPAPIAAQTRVADLDKLDIVQTVSSLFTSKVEDGGQVMTLGYYAFADGGGNTYVYDADSTATIDGGFVMPGRGGVLSFDGSGTFDGATGNGRFIAIDQSVARAKQFGAVGNGIADDTERLQLCIDSEAPNVVIADGTFDISAKLTSNADGQNIVGNGTIIKTAAGNWPILEVTHDNVTIDGLIGVGPDTGATTNLYCGLVRLLNATGCTVKNCRMSKHEGSGITLTGADNASIHNNFLIDASLTADSSSADIFVEGTSNGTTITENRCLSDNNAGIYVGYTTNDSDILVADNQCIVRNADGTDKTTPSRRRNGIMAAYSAASNNNRVTVRGNTVKNALWAGILVQGTTEHVLVEGNTIDNVAIDTQDTEGGVYVAGSAKHVMIANNLISNVGNSKGGVRVGHGGAGAFDGNIFISNNTFKDITRAFYIALSSQKVHVLNNSIELDSAEGLMAAYINPSASVEPAGIVFRGNDFTLPLAGRGIYVAWTPNPATEYVTVEDNQFEVIDDTGEDANDYAIGSARDNLYVRRNKIKGFHSGIHYLSGVTRRVDLSRIEDNRFEDCEVAVNAGDSTSAGLLFVGASNHYENCTAIFDDSGLARTVCVTGSINADGTATLRGTTTPTAGTYVAGDEIINSSPAVGGVVKWVCTTGGVPGTWTEVRQSDVINVRDYGAIPGDATDDTAAIQAALDTGGEVLIPDGDFSIETTLDVPATVQLTFADGAKLTATADIAKVLNIATNGGRIVIRNATIDCNSLSETGITISDVDNVSLLGVTTIANAETGGANTNGGIIADGCSQLEIETLRLDTIRQGAGAGLYRGLDVSNCDGVRVKEVYLEDGDIAANVYATVDVSIGLIYARDITDNGLYIINATENVEVGEVLIDGCGEGVVFDSSIAESNISVDSVTVDGATANGIVLRDGGGYSVGRVSLRECAIATGGSTAVDGVKFGSVRIWQDTATSVRPITLIDASNVTFGSVDVMADAPLANQAVRLEDSAGITFGSLVVRGIGGSAIPTGLFITGSANDNIVVGSLAVSNVTTNYSIVSSTANQDAIYIGSPSAPYGEMIGSRFHGGVQMELRSLDVSNSNDDLLGEYRVYSSDSSNPGVKFRMQTTAQAPNASGGRTVFIDNAGNTVGYIRENTVGPGMSIVLPTSDTGLPSGSIWNREGALTIVDGREDVINVVDYGAVPGDATDDTAAIAAAVAAVPSGGGTVLFPPGTYLSDAFTVSVNGTTIKGNGATIQATSGAVVQVDATDVTIESLIIDGDLTANTGIDVLDDADRCRIRFCEVYDIQNTGATADGIFVGDCKDVDVSHNHVRDVSTTDGEPARGIRFGSSDAGAYVTGVCAHNRVDHVYPVDDGDGIVVQNYPEKSDLVISGNVLTRCAKRAIKLQADGVVVVGNNATMVNVGGGSNPRCAIESMASNATITGNQFTVTAVDAAIALGSSGASNVNVNSNTVSLVSAGANCDYIMVTGAISHFNFTGNSFAGGGRYGVTFDDNASHGIISANNFDDMSNHGIDFGGTTCEDISVTGNTFTNLTGFSVPIYYSGAGTPARCVLHPNQYDGSAADTRNIAHPSIGLADPTLVIYSTGSPEGVVTGVVGQRFIRTDGGTGTTLYLKETGTGNTGWVAK